MLFRSGLPNDISRTDRAVRQAFESALKLMIQSFEQAGGSNNSRRNNALAIAAPCVGGMVLSRSIDDRKLADELRGAALTRRSISGSGEPRYYCGQAEIHRPSKLSCEFNITMSAMAALVCTVPV